MSRTVFPLQKLPFLFHNPFDGERCSIPRNNSLKFSDHQYQLTASCPKFHYNRCLLPFSAACSASSASVSGSEQWLDPAKEQQQRKKRRIAGIDQDELQDPHQLADPDSCFCEFQGVKIHHKLYNPDESQQSHHHHHAHSTTHAQSHRHKMTGLPPLILLHGFGASVFSWNRVMKRLAEVTSSKVVAFDRPAFGLTSRTSSFHPSSPPQDFKPLNPYSMAFSVLATLYFIDFLASHKAILIAHSAGSLVAVNSYFEAPERIAALILVAPAIIAPGRVHKVSGKKEVERDPCSKRYGSNSNMFRNHFVKLLKLLSNFTAYVIQAVMQIVKAVTDMLNSAYKKALSAILCSAIGVMLIRMIIDKFGIAAVRIAWYDSSQLTEHVLDGYTKPLRAKDWDKALAEFTAATLASSVPDSKPPLSKRLHEISCPVLIITGDNDRIVPSWNAKRLSQSIPKAHLEVIKHCGHLPHEEKVEEFVSVVEKFLRGVFADQKELSVQTTI